MKTISKHYQRDGNISLIQLETLKGKGFHFQAAAPAIDKGDLVIREIRSEGAVNTLLAINGTDNFYLLTDMDMLKGAKQNRVVNTSVLIAPNSKQEIDVSCVERSRWSYNTPTFKPGPHVMDSKMRASKADSLREDNKTKSSDTQSRIWGMINEEMVSHNLLSETEDYNSILEFKEREHKHQGKFLQENNCNGLAVFEGRQLVSFDIFGNREVYQYYFSKLAENATGRINQVSGNKPLEKSEAFYRLNEFLDNFEDNLETPVKTNIGHAGELSWSGDEAYPGFELRFEGQPIHMVGFARD